MRLLILGEAMLDVDVDAAATRLAPDAPVPVLENAVEHDRPGGAALAAAMACRDGHEVTLVTPLADDDGQKRLRDALPDAVHVIGTGQDGGTPVKRRIRAGDQNIVRMDSGGTSLPWAEPPAGLAAALEAADCVLVSDYGRGLTHDPMFRAALEGRDPTTPLVWDPHPRGATAVDSTWLHTPNQGELLDVARQHDIVVETTDLGGIAAVATQAADVLPCRALAVTLGARGAILTYGQGVPQVFTAPTVRRGDPCGAGDRFAVAAACALGGGSLLAEAVAAGVEAASRHVSDGGAAALGRLLESDAALSNSRPAASDYDAEDDEEHAESLARRIRHTGGTVVATGGCFDLLHAGHIASLTAARKLGDCLIVCLNSDDSVRRLKGQSRPLVPQADRASVLLGLACVDAVAIFDEDSPVEILNRLRPHVWAKGSDYGTGDLPEAAVLSQWGGAALLLPYLSGRSTTDLVNRSRAADSDEATPDAQRLVKEKH